jgi:hypothetical protein
MRKMIDDLMHPEMDVKHIMNGVPGAASNARCSKGMGRLNSQTGGQNNMLTKACSYPMVLKTPGMNPGQHTVTLLLN